MTQRRPIAVCPNAKTRQHSPAIASSTVIGVGDTTIHACMYAVGDTMATTTLPSISQGPRPTQAERRARSRTALMEAAARGLSRYGYGHLRLEEVAREAGYTRGALYHQFKDKTDLALAVIEWINDNWMREVGEAAAAEADPLAELLAIARGHAVFCRRDIARVVMALRVEFSGHEHPVGLEIERIWETGVKRVARL